tara:strand:+ start:79 stop:1494 length:1416 start_codon:yes stop_codon:yes gene_type:complete
MRNLLIIILIPFSCLAQEIEIKQLPGNINTNGAEINFFQTNDSTAFFTRINNHDKFRESSIYTCRLIDNEWRDKRYTKYNHDILNTANISFSKSGKVVLSNCNKEMKECKIVLLDIKNSEVYRVIPLGYQKETLNTQGHITKHNAQEVLYFVSDRKGGLGGLDIWLSIIDKEGNFGVPINAGNKINSSADEITPFYNTNDGNMYFSSNRKNGAGEFDIYKTEGRFNLWNKPQNVKELNTKRDEMYLTFYNKNEGYLISNRVGAKFENAEYCCNDVFSFKYIYPKEETTTFLSEIDNYLPLALYFHNSEPDFFTVNSTPKKTYKDSYISYFKMKDEYQIKNPNLNDFFEEELEANFNKLNIIFDMLLVALVNGHKIKLKIKGYASPLDSQEYNQALSKRRISSVINYLQQYKDGIFSKHIQSEYLTISELPFGESTAPKKVSDNPNDKKNSIYSIEAMYERKIEIVDLILED